MLRVTLDVSSIQRRAGKLGRQALEQTVRDLGAFAQDRITQSVASQLSPKSAAEYLAGLKVEKTPSEIVIRLEGDAPLRLEKGSSGFDIKKGLLKSAKVKQGKNGPYIDVPIAHTLEAGRPGVHHGAGKVRKTIKAAIQEARRSGQRQRVFAGAHKDGGAVSRIADMRVSEDDQVTFRRVSGRSAPSSWLYPEKPGLKVFIDVANEIRSVAKQMLVNVIGGLKP